MATKNENKEATKNEYAEAIPTVPAQEPAKPRKRLGKELALFTPFIKWHVGLVVLGAITRKYTNMSSYGEKNNIEVQLLADLVFTDSDGEIKELKIGESVNISQTAGLTAVMTLPIGTKIDVECTGKKDMGRGRQPAWEFSVFYE